MAAILELVQYELYIYNFLALCAHKTPVADEFPAQRTSNAAERVSVITSRWVISKYILIQRYGITDVIL